MKTEFVLALSIFVLANILYGQSDYKNLKVLDPKIEESELKLLMKGYAKGLGVKCTFVTFPMPIIRMIKNINSLPVR